jgi:glutamine---fructose-6-phosphate transaminase (isomerizing)
VAEWAQIDVSLTLTTTLERDIRAQGDDWHTALTALHQRSAEISRLWAHANAQQILCTGCGSAYFAGQIVASTASAMLNLPCAAVPASEIVLFPHQHVFPAQRPLLIAASRSGETSETVEAVRVFREHYPQGCVIAVTCAPHSALAHAANLVIDTSHAFESVIVQTRSLTTMLLAMLGVITIAAGHADELLSAAYCLPLDHEHLLTSHENLLQQMAHTYSRYFYLGAGEYHGASRESMLKMKEMSRTQSECFHPLEFRHGLGANADSSSLLIGLINPHAIAPEIAVLNDMARDQAVGVLAFVTDSARDPVQGHVIHVPSRAPRWSRVVLPLPSLQYLALQRALFNGINPDMPTHLHSFIALDAPLRG